MNALSVDQTGNDSCTAIIDSPYSIDPLHPGKTQLVSFLLENVLRVMVGEFAWLAYEGGVLEGVASDLVVQTLQTVQEAAMTKPDVRQW